MGRKRKILLWCLAPFLIVILLALFLDFYASTIGLPDYFRRQLLQRVAAEGLALDARRIRCGFFAGITFENVTVKDGALPGWTLAAIDRLQVDFDRRRLCAGVLVPTGVRVTGGALTVPLADPQAEPDLIVRVSELHLLGRQEGTRFEVKYFTAQFQGVPVRGQAVLPLGGSGGGREQTRNGWRELLAPESGLFSVVRLFPVLKPTRNETRDLLTFIRGAANKAGSEIVLDCHPGTTDPTLRVDFRVQFHRVLYRGMDVESLAVRGTLLPTKVTVPSIVVDLGNGEYVHGEYQIDYAARTVSGLFQSRCYPHKVFRVINPSLLPELGPRLPEFQGAPPQCRINIYPSPLDTARDWRLDLDFSFADAVFQGLPLTRAAGRLELARDGGLQFRDLQLTIAPAIELWGDLYCHEGRHELQMTGVLDGDPRFVAKLGPPAFAQNYLAAWAPFVWEPGTPPHFEFSLLADLNEQTPSLVTRGRARFSGVRYHGVLLDAVEGDVLLDLNGGLLTVDGLTIRRHGQVATGQLAWRFAGAHPRLDYAFESTLEAPVLLGIMHPDWPALLTRYGLALRDPHLRASGFLNLDREGANDLTGTAQLASLRCGELVLANLAGSFHFDGHVLRGTPSCDELTWRDWRATGVHLTDVEFDGTTFTGGGEVQQAWGPGGSAENFAGAYRFRAGTVMAMGTLGKLAFREAQVVDAAFSAVGGADRPLEVHVQAADVRQGEWRLTGVTGALQPTAARVAAQFQAAQAAFRRTRATGVRACLTADEAQLAGLFAVATVEQEGQYRIQDAHAWVAADGAALRGSGQMAAADLPAAGLRGTAIHLADFRSDPDGAVVGRLTVAAGAAGEDCTLRDVTAALVAPGDDLLAAGTSRQVAGAWEAQLPDLQGTLIHHGHLARTDFTLKCPQITARQLTVTEPRVTGQYGDECVEFTLDGRRLTWQDREFTDAHAELRKGVAGVWLRRFQAGFAGGQVRGDAVYDPLRETGLVRFTLDQTVPDRLFVAPGHDEKNLVGGHLSGDFWISFGYLQGRLSLDGRGHVRIREADLWRVPVISTLLELLKLRAARISAADADFLLLDDCLQFVKLRTDGALVALTAEGYYWWRTGGVDFRVRPLFVKGVPNVIPDFLNPLKELTQFHVRGTWQDPHWQPLAEITDLFLDPGKPTDPAGTVKDKP